jgi:integrase/recombinase XerD
MSTVECPSCRSERIWKDGLRYTRNGDVQRYLCRECGYRFSETSWNGSDDPEYVQRVHREPLNTRPKLFSNRQICVTQPTVMKNLAEVETRIEKRAAGATIQDTATLKGKLVEYLWYLKKQGYQKSTIEMRVQRLKRLIRLGANLFDPEDVKKTIANDKWRNSYKASLVSAYSAFVEMIGLEWKPPRYKPVQKLPFVPHEKEIDALIAGCGKKVATSLQLLKETGMRIGEAWNLEWTDIDNENRTVTCTPEKYGTPRQFKVSSKLIAMLNTLPKAGPKVFGGTSLIAHRFNFTTQRKRLAHKLQNPRLLKISFHTLRHWRATMEYHRTKDILHVKEMLGHRQLSSTMVYTHLVHFESKDYHVKTAKTLKEACELAKVGFTYFTKIQGVQVFRKPK